MIQAEFTTNLQETTQSGLTHNKNFVDEVCIFPNEFSKCEANFPEELEVNEMNLRSGKHQPNPCPRLNGMKNIDKGKKVSTLNDQSLPDIPAPCNKDKCIANYNIIAHLKRIPALLTVFDALNLFRLRLVRV